MALLTKNGITKILKRVMETGGLELEEDITRLQTDFEEREGIIKNYGTVPEDEEIDEYEYSPTPAPENTEDFESKYNELKKKYTDRFFGSTAGEVEEVKEDNEEDIKKDGEEQTFDTLFEKVEG